MRRRLFGPGWSRLVGGAAVLVILAACATQPAAQAQAPGFWAGLGHGLVALPALLASLFFNIRIYAFPNDGFGYDAGFAIGFCASIVLAIMLSIARIGGFVTRGN